MGREEKDIELLRARTRVSEADVRKDRTDGNGYSPRSIEALCEGGVSSDLTQIDLRSLPSILLSERKSLPKKVSAIYFALSSSDEVLYIGRAVCLHDRWSGQKHHRRVQLEELGGVRIAWMQVSDPVLLPEIETALIKHFSPLLNVSNNEFPFQRGTCEPPKTKTYKIRFSDWEWQRLESAAKRRNVPIAQVIREGLTLALDKEPQAS